MMTVLRNYEQVSGQLINKSKSLFYLHDKVPLIFTVRLRKLVGIRNGEFRVTYLGCPVYYGKKRAYYEDNIRKLSRRILAWQNRFLTFGGKLVLIKHVRKSMPIYLLLAMCPPKGVIKKMHQISAKFF